MIGPHLCRRGLLLAVGMAIAPAAAAADSATAPRVAETARSAAFPGSIAIHADTVPSDTVAVEAIDVTVLRTTIPLFGAPMAVSALGEDRLRTGRSGVFLEEALQGLPGVQVQNRFNPAVGERVAIRGFGARAQFGMRGIRVMVDGIPATLPDGQSTLDHLDIGSLGRVEAVRGPSSALFGNASGGVLAFHTRSPATTPLRAEVEQVIGSHGLARTQATASGTVGESGYLVTASRIAWDGFRADPTAEGETYGAADRLGLNARLTRPLAGGELSFSANVADLDAENPGSVAEELRADPDRPVVAFPYLAHATRKELEQAQGGIRWEGSVAGGLDADFSAFGVRRNVVNPVPFNFIDLSRRAAGMRAQVSRAEDRGWGELRWHSGMELELQDDERNEFANDGGEAGALRTDQTERVRAAGVFLQADLRFADGVQALAGLRYDHHDFRADDRIERDPGDFSATGSRTMDALSPSLGVNVPVGPSSGIFASLGTVFETPSTTELKNRPGGAGGFNPDLNPQKGVSGEVGIRHRISPRTAIELTTYRTDLTDELIPFEVPEVAGQVYFRNVGSSRHTGVEATLSAISASGLLSTDLAYTRMNARFRNYQLEGEELGGNRVPGVAPHRAQATLRLTPEPWFGHLTGSYVHRVPVNDQNTAAAPSHVLLDLRGGVRDLTLIGGMEFSPWLAVTNVLDRHYTASAAVNAAGGRYYEPGPGRSFQIGVRASF